MNELPVIAAPSNIFVKACPTAGKTRTVFAALSSALLMRSAPQAAAVILHSLAVPRVEPPMTDRLLCDGAPVEVDNELARSDANEEPVPLHVHEHVGHGRPVSSDGVGQCRRICTTRVVGLLTDDDVGWASPPISASLTSTRASASERALYHRRRIGALASKAKRWASWYAAKRREGAVLTLRPPVPEGLRHRLFRAAKGIAEKNHRAVPYPGRVVFWFAKGMDDRAALGWPGLPAEFDIRPIGGAPRMARDLTMEPSVGVLASMIRGEFEHLDRTSS